MISALPMQRLAALAMILGVVWAWSAGCGSGGSGTSAEPPGVDPIPFADDWPAAGTVDRLCRLPEGADALDASLPDRVVGDGTPQSCTSRAFVEAVAAGGLIAFDCGPDPVTITLTDTARVFNDTGLEIVIDGGGRVTLSGGGARRILIMNTCDPDLVWTTPHCQNQDHPRLTVQNLTFANGYAGDDEGGGAIFVRGGRFKIVNCRFFNNRCADAGSDVGGAAVRVLSQYDGQPVYVVGSTFGGRSDLGNNGDHPGKMTTEEAFIKVLQMHGIEHAFGIIGSAFMPISDLFPKRGSPSGMSGMKATPA
jgi:hypothetical protein